MLTQLVKLAVFLKCVSGTGHNCYSFAMMGRTHASVSSRHRNPGVVGGLGLLRRPFSSEALWKAVKADFVNARPRAACSGSCVCAYRREDGQNFHFARQEGPGEWLHLWSGTVMRMQGQLPDVTFASDYRLAFCYDLA